jgi:hypothetical protein
MLMMHVGHMRVRMSDRPMAMRMRVGLTGRIVRSVLMLMVLVMQVSMGMDGRLVKMLVLMSLGQV